MASAARTPNLSLPQWTAGEKPERTDFNAAFLALDNDAMDRGWERLSGTWTYASITTVTVASGAAAIYRIGDYIRWKNGGVYRYGTLKTVADTVLTIFMNDNYLFSNAAITDIWISRAANPWGFPSYFDFTPTITCGAGVPTTVTVTQKYRVQNGTVFICGTFSVTNKGTATGYLGISLPYNANLPTVGICAESAASGISGSAITITTAVILQLYNNGTLWVNGYAGNYSLQYFI